MKAFVENTAVIAIDYQEKLIPAMNNKLEFVHNSEILLKGMDILNVTTLLTRQYAHGLGDTISPIAEATADCGTFDKMSFSCLGNEEVFDVLDGLNVENVIVCGCEAHICVLQTVIDLIAEKYNVYLVTDCIASRRAEDKKYAIKRAEQEGALMTTYEAILFELLGTATDENFKAVSKLIK